MTQVGNVISPDGTSIGFRCGGAGPPIVLVHGTSATSMRWLTVVPLLEPHFTVYCMDRRGRGLSDDASTYEIEREFEDVAALIKSFEGPVNLLGHSYGAICVLEAALIAPEHVRRLILYEPPLPEYPLGPVERMEHLLAAGDREGVVTMFSREILRMSPEDFERFRASPAWAARVAAAHTLPRELRAHHRYRRDPQRFRQMCVPTLLMVGEHSPAFLKDGVEAARAAVPLSSVVTLTGQQHIAMDTAPELFVHEVLTFLK